ncbi:glycoside hydrolase family 31 protein [candidate division KSB1 bacterium]|nr:glycoside hydrolase family 31 protein [candidate division KSB1 bacterium]
MAIDFSSDQGVLTIHNGTETLCIEAWGKNSIRVRATRNREIRDDLPQALLPCSTQGLEIETSEAGAAATNGNLQIRIDGKCRMAFYRVDTGQKILAEQPLHFMLPARDYRSAGGILFHTTVNWQACDDERFYGMGQHPLPFLDQKGCTIELMQKNTEVSIPFVLSNRGYGFLWNNPAIGRAEFARNHTRWVAEATEQIDYWVTVADTPGEIVQNYVQATGLPPMLPEWAAGFWQCKLRYRTQAELLEVAREYRRRNLPLSVLVIDFFYSVYMGDLALDPADWPDPEAMMRELDEMGIRVMISIWPAFNVLSRNYAEMAAKGYLIQTERGQLAHQLFVDRSVPGPAYIHYYDATHPEARKLLWQIVRDNLYRLGIKIWWLDACEPETYPIHPDHLRYHLGPGLAVGNIYPLLHASGFYEGMKAEGETEILCLCRSAWAGSQRYGAAVWSGDIHSSFDDLRSQVRAGLNMAISGIPWWTTDIGGFTGGDPQDEGFRELIVRWFQYGTFCPLFRLHGNRLPEQDFNGGPNEVWSFGEKAYAIIRELLLLRERLRPYILAHMRIAHETGLPMMRPLFIDFPNDAKAWKTEDAFLFGPDLLVAPILEAGSRSRRVYLPRGARWTDAWSKVDYTGGQTIEVDAPLDRIPLFLRDDAILPIE